MMKRKILIIVRKSNKMKKTKRNLTMMKNNRKKRFFNKKSRKIKKNRANFLSKLPPFDLNALLSLLKYRKLFNHHKENKVKLPPVLVK